MVVAKVKLVVRRYNSGGDDHGGVVDHGGDWLWLRSVKLLVTQSLPESSLVGGRYEDGGAGDDGAGG